MAADLSALAELLPGRSYRLHRPYEVSVEKIREFAAAVGETHPAFHEVEAAVRRGCSDVMAPPTFPIVIAFKVLQQLLADPKLAIDLRRVVHGEQRFVTVRPLCAGDVLECTTSVETVRSLGGSLVLGTRSELREVGSFTPVVTAHATLLIGSEVT